MRHLQKILHTSDACCGRDPSEDGSGPRDRWTTFDSHQPLPAQDQSREADADSILFPPSTNDPWEEKEGEEQRIDPGQHNKAVTWREYKWAHPYHTDAENEKAWQEFEIVKDDDDFGGVHHFRSLFPPLCPELELPLCQMRFWISVKQAKAFYGDGTLDIMAMTGPVMRLQHRQDGESGAIAMELLKTRGEKNELVASLGMPPASRQRKYRFVLDRHGSDNVALEIRYPDGTVYGVLEPKTTEEFAVVYLPTDDEPHRTILHLEVQPTLFKAMMSNSGHSKVLEVRRAENKPGYLIINAMQGCDVSVALLCLLAALLPSVSGGPPG